ncbi:MAG: HEAT repeat domain-containing protein [Proteobacteria bacterium]|jgi:hypothetical protein|nr:HEAT repeat domain-containing protein [Pseudomonadota bacterium]
MPTRLIQCTASALALFLASAAASALAPPQQAAPADKSVVIPDSRGWTVDQAIVNLRSSDKGLRLAGLYRLFKEPGPGIQKWIAEAAQYDPEPRIRYEAVKALQARNEPESLPILMHIAETDKDDRVRTAARIASGVGGPAGGQPVAPAPPPEAGAQPTPPPAKRYDAAGNELPPGYLDGDPAGGQAGFGGGGEVPWGEDVDPEEVGKSTGGTARAHSGFLPQLGFDGAMGSPRDTLNRSDVGLQLGFGYGRFDGTVHMDAAAGIDSAESRGVNRFTFTDFSMTILGHWSPGKYFEVGLSAEVLTVEKLEHQQRWERMGSDDNWEMVGYWEDAPDGYYSVDEPEQLGLIYQDSSHKSAAFGLVSLDLKSIFLQRDVVRAGIVARVTFPTHMGARFDEGLGAADLYLPGSSGIDPKTGHFTDEGTVWGIEPGVVASVAPVEHLTIYADLTFAMAFLKYNVVEKDLSNSDTLENKTTNLFFIPHFGAQYRILDDKLGFQVAFSPVAFVGKGGETGLAAFAIVPGVSTRLAEHLNLSLTVDIDVGANAAHPFESPRLLSDTDAQLSEPTPCGVGRQVGLALQAAWEF